MQSVGDNFIDNNVFLKKMLTMGCMIILTAIVVLISHVKNSPLSVFPRKFTKSYIIFTLIALALIFSTPGIYTRGITELMTVLYGSIVTPIYEETLFRGLIYGLILGFVRMKTHNCYSTILLHGVLNVFAF